MICGVGIDIVQIDRLRPRLKVRKTALTERELAKYERAENKEAFLAKCWAVKEAACKASGGEFDMSVEYDSPNVVIPYLKEGYKAWCSVSDEKEYAVALVVIEKEG